MLLSDVGFSLTLTWFQLLLLILPTNDIVHFLQILVQLPYHLSKDLMTTMGRCIQSVFVMVALGVINVTGYIPHTFNDSTYSTLFEHFVINKHTGHIYIGAINRIYQLTEDLDEIRSITTGPQLYHPDCPPEGSCDYEKILSDSENEALAIDYGAGRLISCTNLFHGRCVKYDLEDISVKYDPVFNAIVSSHDGYGSNVLMFVAPGPPNNTSVLYLAVTRSHTGSYNNLTPAISSRNLETFQLASSNGTAATKKEFIADQLYSSPVYNIYGFSSGGFSYFLSVQKQSVDVTTHSYVTRIARVCQSDPNYYSYTEVPLACNHNGENYNVLRAAYKAHPGGDLARDLGLAHIPPLSDMNDVLFGLFTKDYHMIVLSPVLCVFTLQAIRRVFTESIQNCFSGVGHTGPGHIVEPQPCIPTVSRSRLLLSIGMQLYYLFNWIIHIPPTKFLQLAVANANIKFEGR